jgi:hypothetical protein
LSFEALRAAPAPAKPVSLRELIGTNRGQFKSVEDVDAYIRQLRDEWDR